MQKTNIQILIAAVALTAALALTVTAAYATECTDQCKLKPREWKEYRTENGADFASDWLLASRQCGGENTACIEEKLKEKGWSWGEKRNAE